MVPIQTRGSQGVQRLHRVVQYAYVYEKIKKKLAPWIQENEDEGTKTEILKELAEELSARMHLAGPKLPYIEPPPAQMLRFTNLIPAEVFTNRVLVDTDKNPLQIQLVDIESGEICEGALASLEVEVFVTRGNFPSDDSKLRKCKALSPRNKATQPLLVQAIATKTAGRRLSRKTKFVVKLRNGKADVRGKITDNSKWVRSGKFKLVARVMARSYQGRRIKEALSEAFTVKESKLEGHRKHDIPLPNDPTWRLINVGKKYHKRLQDIGINTVQDFLNKLESNPDCLKKTLGMQNMKWEATVEHARKCRVQEEETNISNSRGNDMGDSVSALLNNQQGLEEQMVPDSNLAPDQMDGCPSNISFNGNGEPNEIYEGNGGLSTVHQNFTRLYSNQWTHDFSWSESMEGADNHPYFN